MHSYGCFLSYKVLNEDISYIFTHFCVIAYNSWFIETLQTTLFFLWSTWDDFSIKRIFTNIWRDLIEHREGNDCGVALNLQ